MLPTPHPEVLADDWLPPVVLGREVEVREVVRRLDPPRPHAPPPWMVGVVGSRGAGSSSVARRAAREVADRIRAAIPGSAPRQLAVRTAGCRGTHGVASELLRRLDDGFDGRGFPIAEIVAGVLRRLRRDGRPVVLVLDDVRAGGPDLGPLLRAIGAPDRFLPEGESGLPPFWTVLAGTADAMRRAEAELHGRGRIGPLIRLAPYSADSLRRLLEDRADRVLGRAAPADLLTRVLERTVADGGGAARAVELLRRTLLPGAARRAGPFAPLRRPGVPLTIESRVVRAIEEVSQGRAAPLGEIRRSEARLARAEGAAPLPATTLWRRIVRLEQAGYVRRDVRPGGVGGTRSVLRVLAPTDEWLIARLPPETHPGSDAWAPAPWSPGGLAEEGQRPASAPSPPDDATG